VTGREELELVARWRREMGIYGGDGEEEPSVRRKKTVGRETRRRTHAGADIISIERQG
jgi:hypothetical protein